MEKDCWASTVVEKIHTEYPVEHEIVMAYGGECMGSVFFGGEGGWGKLL